MPFSKLKITLSIPDAGWTAVDARPRRLGADCWSPWLGDGDAPAAAAGPARRGDARAAVAGQWPARHSWCAAARETAGCGASWAESRSSPRLNGGKG